MFTFHSKYFVYRELKKVPQKLSFCFKCPDIGTVLILGNILYGGLARELCVFDTNAKICRDIYIPRLLNFWYSAKLDCLIPAY